jgi:type IV secretory pathway TraG/TraD family ATPase VirD4
MDTWRVSAMGDAALLAFALALMAIAIGLWSRRAPALRYLLVPIAAAALSPLVLGFCGVVEAALVLLRLPRGPIVWLLPAMLLPIAGVAAGRLMGRALPAGRVQRGAQVLDARTSARAARRLARVADTRGLTLAGVVIPSEDEVKHFKFVGTTGTGKTTAIAELLAAALARGDRAVVADADGHYLSRFHDPRRGDVVLNPFERGSRRWDLFGEIDRPYHVEQLARALIAESNGAAQEWTAYARSFFTAVMHQLHAAQADEPEELYRLLMVAELPELRTLLEGTAAQALVAPENERMFASLRAVAASSLAPLDYVCRQRGKPLSVRRWVRSGGGVLFLPYAAEQISALRTLMACWIRLAIFQALSLPVGRDGAPRRIWFIVDELDALGTIDGLKDALARLRKFGGRCVLGLQSIAQVSAIYGHGDAQTIVENCANTLLLRCSASEGGGTARFASELVGEREVIQPQLSRTRSASWLAHGGATVSQGTERRTEAALLPAELEQLPDLAGYLKLASEPAWLRVQLRR